MPATSQISQPVSVSIADGAGTAMRLEKAWARIVSETAGGYAYLSTLAPLLKKEDWDLGPAVGRGNLYLAGQYLQRFKDDHTVAVRLSDGSAVLVSYQDAQGVHIGVYPTRNLPQSLGVIWKYIALGAGSILAGFYFRIWELELETLKAESNKIFLKVADTMAKTVEMVAATDPAAAARIAEANAQALRVAASARASPQSWLEKILGTDMGSPFIIIGGLVLLAAYYRQRGRA